MPKLLSGQVLRTGGSGQFLSLPNAQPALGPSPTTSSGYTLVTSPAGITSYSNILGNITFFEGSLTNYVADQNIVIRTTGNGSLFVDTSATFTNPVIFLSTFTFTDITASGAIRFTAGTPSNDYLSGTLVVTGGVGISEDLYVNNDFHVNGTLEGRGQVTLSPAGNNVTIQPSSGGSVTINPSSLGSVDNMQIGQSTARSGKFTILEATESLVVSSPTNSISTTTGAVTVVGGVGVAGDLRASNLYGNRVFDNDIRVLNTVIAGTGLSGGGSGPSVALTNTGVLSLTAGTGTFVSKTTGDVTLWTYGNTLQQVTEQGNTTTEPVYFNNPTNATSSTTGSVVISGGLGVVKDVTVSGSINTPLLNAQNIIAPTASIFSLKATGSNASTATLTDNALYVTGGAGVQSNLTVGGNTFIYGNLTVLGTQTTTVSTLADLGRKVVALSTSAGPAILSIDSGITVGPVSSPFVKFLFDGISSWKSTGNIIPATSNIYTLGNSTYQWSNLYTQNINITGLTQATNTISGALILSGGAGIGKNLYVGGQINSVNTTPSSSTGTGALVVLGGAGIAGAVYIGGQLRVQTTTNSTSTNTGALTVSGGAGFAGDVYAKNFFDATGNKFITTASLSSFVVTSLTAGTDTAVSGSTGYITVWNTSTLQSITARGATTNAVVDFTNTTTSISTNTGAVRITGGLGIGKDLFVGGNIVINGNVAFNGTVTSVLSTNTIYTDNIIELHTPPLDKWNFNDGKDIGVKFRYFSTTSDSAFLGRANDSGYLEWYESGSEFANSSTFIGTYGTFKTGKIQLTGGVDSSGQGSGSLVVEGGIGITGKLYGGNIYSNNSIVLTAASISNYGISLLTAGTGTAISTSTGDVTIWSTANLQQVTNAGNITDNSISITNPTASTSTITGALVVAGGAGISGPVWLGSTIRATTATLHGIEVYGDPIDATPQATALFQTAAVAGYASITLANSSVNGQSFTIDVGGNNRSGGNGTHTDEGNFTIKDDTADLYRLIVAKNTGNVLIGKTSDNLVDKLQVDGSIFASTASFTDLNIIGLNVVNSNTYITGTLEVINTATFYGGFTSNSTSTFNKTVIVGSSSLETAITNINTIDPTPIDSFDATLYRSARSLVQITESGIFHLVEVVLLHDGVSQVYKSEYGIIATGDQLGDFTAELVANRVVLYFTAYSATSKSVNVVRTTISV
jgi:hypothetical protein